MEKKQLPFRLASFKGYISTAQVIQRRMGYLLKRGLIRMKESSLNLFVGRLRKTKTAQSGYLDSEQRYVLSLTHNRVIPSLS
jgi:hypothetical protein